MRRKNKRPPSSTEEDVDEEGRLSTKKSKKSTDDGYLKNPRVHRRQGHHSRHWKKLQEARKDEEEENTTQSSDSSSSSDTHYCLVSPSSSFPSSSLIEDYSSNWPQGQRIRNRCSHCSSSSSSCSPPPPSPLFYPISGELDWRSLSWAEHKYDKFCIDFVLGLLTAKEHCGFCRGEGVSLPASLRHRCRTASPIVVRQTEESCSNPETRQSLLQECATSIRKGAERAEIVMCEGHCSAKEFRYFDHSIDREKTAGPKDLSVTSNDAVSSRQPESNNGHGFSIIFTDVEHLCGAQLTHLCKRCDISDIKVNVRDGRVTVRFQSVATAVNVVEGQQQQPAKQGEQMKEEDAEVASAEVMPMTRNIIHRYMRAVALVLAGKKLPQKA